MSYSLRAASFTENTLFLIRMKNPDDSLLFTYLSLFLCGFFVVGPVILTFVKGVREESKAKP